MLRSRASIFKKSILKQLKPKRANYAVIRSIEGDRVSITTGSSPNVLRHIEVVGDITALRVGQTVPITWEKLAGSRGESPIVFAGGVVSGVGSMTTGSFGPDGVVLVNTAAGVTVRNAGIQDRHLAQQYAYAGHSHDFLPGWSVDEDGTLVSGETFIHNDGQIVLGLSPDVMKLDSNHSTYRFWIGHLDPTQADFAVEKDGAIHSTAGFIGGWSIEATQISSDTGSAFVNSSTPAIGLGGTAYNTGTGFWVGKDTGVYKMHIGNPAGDVLTWDGTNLSVTGGITASSGSIGGWTLAANTLSSGSIVLDSSVPSIEVGAASYGAAGIWMGNNGGTYMFSIGDPAGELLTWDGNRLSINTVNLVVQDVISTRSGEIIVAPTALLTSDLAAAATTIYVDEEIFDSGDVVMLKARGNFEVITIDSAHSGTGPYSYTISRGVGASGADDWFIGDAVFNSGAANDPLIDIFAGQNILGDAVGPTMVGYIRGSSTWNDLTPRWALGDLDGLYGYGATAYGAAFGEYASGKVNVTIDSTNGLRIRNNTTVLGQWDTSGVITLGEAATSGWMQISSGSVYMYDASTNLMLGVDADGVHIGDTADNVGNMLFASEKLQMRSGLNGLVVNWDLDENGTMRGGATGLSSTWYYQIDGTTGNISTDGGLYVGSDTSSASAGNVVAVNDVLAGGGMYVGSTGSNPGTGILIATSDIISGGGIYSGSVLGSPSTGDVVGTGDFLAGGGVVIGSTAVNPAAGELRVSGGAYFGGTGVTPTSGVVQTTSHIKSGGAMYVGSATGTTIGTGSLVLDQGANDTNILQMRSSDVAHGMTTLVPTDTYGSFYKGDAATGALVVSGYGESTRGVQFIGIATTATTARSTSALAPVLIQAGKKDGTTWGTVSTNGNLVAIYDYASCRAIFDREGELHLDATLGENVWDDYDDMELLTVARLAMLDPSHELAQKHNDWVERSRPILEATGVITYNDEGDGIPFVAMKRLQALQIDAMRQLYERNQLLEARLERMERLLGDGNVF